MLSTHALIIGQQFEVEHSRAIDATADPVQLKALTKQLLQTWHTLKAATEWVKSKQLWSPYEVNKVSPLPLLVSMSDSPKSRERNRLREPCRNRPQGCLPSLNKAMNAGS